MDRSQGMMFEMEKQRQEAGPQLAISNPLIEKLESENKQLRAKVKQLQQDKDAVHSALDEIHDRLEDTTLELEDTRLALANSIKELAKKSSEASTLSQEPQQQNLQELERLRNELQVKDESILRQDKIWKEQTERLHTEYEAKLAYQTEEAQKHFAEQNLQYQKAKSKWKDKIRQLQEKIDDKFKTTQATSQNLLSEQQIQMEEAAKQTQSLHQSQLQSTQVEATSTRSNQVQSTLIIPQLQTQESVPSPPAQDANLHDFPKMIEELKASYAVELEASRRLTDFFKNNSERVSREARELKKDNKNLKESIEVKDRELEDQLSHIYALEAQMEEMDKQASMSMQNQASIAMPGMWEEDHTMLG